MTAGIFIRALSVFSLKVKGNKRVIAITDSIMAAGLPATGKILASRQRCCGGGRRREACGERRACGKHTDTESALRNLLAFTGRPFGGDRSLLSENPARMLNIYDRKGSIADGKDADLVLLDQENEVCCVFAGGRKIHA